MSSANFQFDVGSRGPVERIPEPSHAKFADAYDAIRPGNKRKQPGSRIIREDQHLVGRRRDQLIANAGDLRRNMAIAAWMVRKHLDYVSRFAYQPKTKDRGLARELKRLMAIASRAENMDRGARLGREKMFRWAEARRTLDGDCGLIRLASGQMQCIKGDLIKTPAEPRPGAEWESGVRIDRAGRPMSYGIHRRTPGGRSTEFSREIAATRFIHYGFFEEAPADQVRGVSPFTAAIADLRDVYESIDYTKIKIKLAQLLGIAFTRKDSSEDLNTAMPGASTDPATSAESDSCGDDEEEPRVIDWTHGLTTFDLDEGESVEVVESQTPATETLNFLKLVIMIALKSLDLPFSFFDEKHTNFHGSRGAFLQYDRSCLDKRDDQIEMRRRWTNWKHQQWVFDGTLVLPSGMDVLDLEFEWIPKGMPWWKPSEEVVGALKAIGGGLDNPERVCNEFDRGDVYENIDKILDVIAYAHEQGVERIGEPLRLSFEAEFPQILQTLTEEPVDDE